MAKKQFKAESKRLLDMMINSIYTHKEIFLRELVSNASDAIDKLYFQSLTDDSVKLKKKDFCIRLAVDKDTRTLTVRDNGIGMSEKTVSHIFEPYYTTKPNGTGLGMTMVYKIIKEFSGDIAVSSSRGKGSCFTITLPVPQTKTCLLPHDKETENPPAVKVESEK